MPDGLLHSNRHALFRNLLTNSACSIIIGWLNVRPHEGLVHGSKGKWLWPITVLPHVLWLVVPITWLVMRLFIVGNWLLVEKPHFLLVRGVWLPLRWLLLLNASAGWLSSIEHNSLLADSTELFILLDVFCKVIRGSESARRCIG